MQTVKFVLSPLNNIVSLNEVNINHVDLVIDRIKSNGDKFLIPNDFYTTKDRNGKTIYDYLFEQGKHEIDLLRQIVLQTSGVDESYTELFSQDKVGYVTFDKSGFSCTYRPYNANIDLVARSHLNISIYTQFIHKNTPSISILQSFHILYERGMPLRRMNYLYQRILSLLSSRQFKEHILL